MRPEGWPGFEVVKELEETVANSAIYCNVKNEIIKS
jgi:hypothetical protein